MQGRAIDSAKGITVDPFPQHWIKWTKVTDEMTKEEIERTNFNNSIIVDKRPYFFKHLYGDYNKQFKNYNSAFSNYCVTNLGKSLEEVLSNPITDAEINTKNKYFRHSPLLDSDCAMNKICHYMEKNIKQIKIDMKTDQSESTVNILKSYNIELDNEKFEKLLELYKKYKIGKRIFATIKNVEGDSAYKTLEQYNKFIRQEAQLISNNIQELANMSIIICYEKYPSDSKGFAWNIFSEGIIRNIEENRQDECFIPVLDSNGEIEYLGNHYTMKKVDPFFEEDDGDNDYL
jgi:hypothetical protein